MAGNPAVVQSMIKEHEQHVMELFKTIDKLANKYNVRITEVTYSEPSDIQTNTKPEVTNSWYPYKTEVANSWYANQYKTGSRKQLISKPMQNRKSQTADTLISNNHMRLETVSFATVKYRVYSRKKQTNKAVLVLMAIFNIIYFFT